MVAAVRSGTFRDAAGPRPAMHPNVLDSELGALAHRLLGDVRSGADDDRLDAARNSAQ
jgi:hypothetical protein